MEGRILKGIGSFYTVSTADGTEYVCRARGRFRERGVMPVPGDYVLFDPPREGDGYLLDVLARKNLLVRPPVANIDQLFVVISATVPVPDLLLVDKLLIQCEALGIAPVLVVNKCDGGENDRFAAYCAEYAPTGYPVLPVSAREGRGIDAILARMQGKTSCFAGQSAVGKSSILNCVIPGASLEVGGLSRKTDRGRHTTRHVELLKTGNGGYVMDTPGFSLLDLTREDPLMLARDYPEMREHLGMCRYPSCVHVHEPGCLVKELLENGKISSGRYERYCILVQELIEKRKHQYD